MERLVSFIRRPALLGLLASLSLVLAACASSSSTYSAAPAAGTPAAIPQTGGAVVQTANNPKFGQILVTADGRTLYTNTFDTPTASKCVDASCTGFWQALTVNGQPTAGKGVTGTLGTIARPDGSRQVTYNQKPLYVFTLDKKPGDATGEGVTDSGGTWHVALASGAAPNSAPNSTPSSTPGAGAGGYPYPSYP